MRRALLVLELVVLSVIAGAAIALAGYLVGEVIGSVLEAIA